MRVARQHTRPATATDALKPCNAAAVSQGGGEGQGLTTQAPRHAGHTSQVAEKVQPTDTHTGQPTSAITLALVQMRFGNKQHVESQNQ
jgi:hypothetical protein